MQRFSNCGCPSAFSERGRVSRAFRHRKLFFFLPQPSLRSSPFINRRVGLFSLCKLKMPPSSSISPTGPPSEDRYVYQHNRDLGRQVAVSEGKLQHRILQT
ncbi:hypothetical protein TNCT_360191 [Trichonephila clavata]|uniref:Uncharacterized protein n=1 Tax=Trichonephila clavata TaxID=2740835 RepID=A0A8X6I114_TRICU|nr:hypothetical protein TNCT_360191 [Trichonephila clavata]